MSDMPARKNDPPDLHGIVERAVGRALDKRHRGLLLEAGTIAAVVAFGIALALVLIITGERRSDAHRQTAVTRQQAKSQTVALCHTSAKARPQSNARGFTEVVTLDALLDVMTPAEKKKVNDLLDQQIAAELPYAPGQHLDRVHTIEDLAQVVQNLPLLDCAKTVS